MNKGDVAKSLDISIADVEILIEQGELKTYIAGKKTVKVEWSSFCKYKRRRDGLDYYQVVEGSTVSKLVKAVNAAIAEGWEPIGGIMHYERPGSQAQDDEDHEDDFCDPDEPPMHPDDVQFSGFFQAMHNPKRIKL